MLTILLLLLTSSAYGGSICNDGWVSPSEGSGACSYHGGISARGGPSLSSGWDFSSGITNSGTVYFGLSRKDLSIWTGVSCYAVVPVGWTFDIYLFSASGGPLARAMDYTHNLADGTTALNVFVRKGDAVERIVSWDVSVKDHEGRGGAFVMEKKMNVESPRQAGGVLFLTEADLMKIERADSLHVSLYVGGIATDNLNTYQLDMSELRGKLPALRQRCTAASVQAATTNKEKK